MFNYNFLKGKIVEKCGSQAKFAESLGVSDQSLSAKLLNKIKFSQEEIYKTIKILELTDSETIKCFFNA